MNKKKIWAITVTALILTITIASVAISAGGSSSKKEWKTYTAYKVNQQVTYEGNTYSCIQAHTSLPGWQPTLTPALWGIVKSGNKTSKPITNKPITNKPTATVKPTTTSSKTPIPDNSKTPSPSQTVTPSNDDNSGKLDSSVFAPYVDVCLYPAFDINSCFSKTGQKFYTLAFITANGSGDPAWGGVIPLGDNHYKDQIDKLRKNNGDVIVSFGGAAGNELALANSNVDTLVSKYQSVIDKYSLKWIDFDIEGAAVANKSSIDVRNKAAKKLQDKNPGLTIAYCLPVLPSGLTSDGEYVLQNAKDNGVKVDMVNVMAMDYGDGAAPNPDGQMGKYAIQAAESTLSQVNKIGLSSKIGVTPMIGQNDAQSEVFTLADAKTLLNWAKSNSKAGFLSMWSATRDNGNGGVNRSANALYSGIQQNEFDFINIFKSY